VKKILGLALAAFMVMGLVGGGTWAYFSDPETSTATLAGGTLDLVVDGENPWATAYVSVSNMMPGDTEDQASITITNNGSVTADLWFRITSVTNGGGPALYDPGSGNITSTEPEYIAEGGPGSHSADDNLSDNLTLTKCEVDAAPVSGYDSANVTSAANTGWKLIKDNMAASGTVTFELDVKLHDNTGNTAQGDNCTFDIEFRLMQDGQTLP